MSAGWGVQLWDVSAAALLQTLLLDDLAQPDMGGAVQPYTCVSYMGELLAAGRRGEVVLVDPRVGGVAGRLRCPVGSSTGGIGVGRTAAAASIGGGGGAAGMYGSGGGGGFGMGLGSIAAAAGGAGAGGVFGGEAGVAAAAAALAGNGGGGGGGGERQCVGVQLDEWKLVCGFNDGRRQLHLYDIRSLPGGSAAGGGVEAGAVGSATVRCGARGPWHTPLMTFTAPARVNCFQVWDITIEARILIDCSHILPSCQSSPAVGLVGLRLRRLVPITEVRLPQFRIGGHQRHPVDALMVFSMLN